MRRGKIIATFRKRDWRWLWLRTRPFDVELFRGYIEQWNVPEETEDAG